jgi:hypothetical protein
MICAGWADTPINHAHRHHRSPARDHAIQKKTAVIRLSSIVLPQ